MHPRSQVLIVIPAYNEEATIREVVTRSLNYADVSVTNDGSKDRTGAILSEIQKECHDGVHPHGLHVITHEKSTHIPQGIQDGLRYGVLLGYRFIITMDAGLSHDPDALPDFINEDHRFDVVIGMRKNVQNVPFYRRFVSRSAALVMNYALSQKYLDVIGPRIRDTTSGFRRYSLRAATVISEAELKSKSFDFHMEALALCIRSGFSAKEIPITYVFSNSSFNRKVLLQAMKFGFYLLGTKKETVKPVKVHLTGGVSE